MKEGVLDAVGKKVLYELDIDSRQTIAQISKKIKVSAKKVQDHIFEFERTGKIVSYISVIDYKRAGQYTFYVCNIRTIGISPAQEEEILKTIAKMPECTLAFRCLGPWDIMIGTAAKDIFQAKENFNKFLELFGDRVEKRMIVTHMGAYHYGRRYLLESVKDSEKYDAPMLKSAPEPYAVTGGRNKPEDIDGTDEKLLRILAGNARMPSVELATLTNTTPEDVGKRIRKLIAHKIIRYFTVLVDPDKDEYKFFRVYVKLRNSTYADQIKIIEQMRKYTNVYRVIEIFEEYGFAIDIIAMSEERMKKILSSLKENNPDKIVYYDVCHIYKMYKNCYYITEKFRPMWMR